MPAASKAQLPKDPETVCKLRESVSQGVTWVGQVVHLVNVDSDSAPVQSKRHHAHEGHCHLPGPCGPLKVIQESLQCRPTLASHHQNSLW